jgi:hypothetical protein
MPANWGTFITNVSSKLTSQSIGSYDEMADFLRNEYISATVGKAASPYLETHVKGQDAIMYEGFKKGFKILYEGGDLTFEEKKTNPAYADLEAEPPTVDISGAADQVDLDFRDWVEANKSTIPPFVYSQFFSQFPGFPKDRKQAVIEIARKILYQFDGTSSYLQWMYSLRTGRYSDWGNLIMDEVIKLINIEAKREFQPGDLVRGFAKYKNIDRITVSTVNQNGNFTSVIVSDNYIPRSYQENVTAKTGNEVFNYIKGDTNIDNISSLSSGKQNDSELIEGKVVSVSSVKGDSSIKVSFYNKNVEKYFVKELIPSTVTRKLKLADIAGKLPAVSITRQLFQDQHLSNPNKIPGYLTSDFIRHFTYSKRYDSGYLRQWLKYYGSWSDSAIDNINKSFDDSYSYADDIIGIFSKDGFKNTSFFRKNSNIFGNNSIFELSIIKQRLDFSKEIEYNGEENRFRELKIRWINELADAARKNEDPDKPEDPYNVMAKGVLDYWKSCAQQPLSKEPGAPPALFAAPQGGLYAPVYYGSQTMLGNNIKRAFNTGKRFSQSYEKQIAAKLVASALAYSFAMHLLELKFIYRGGIPGPNGPIPMIGFIPLVY